MHTTLGDVLAAHWDEVETFAVVFVVLALAKLVLR